MLEKLLKLLDRREMVDDDDRSDIRKLINTATGPDTVLVRVHTGTPERPEIAIFDEQRYPCRCSEARWIHDAATVFLETPWPQKINQPLRELPYRPDLAKTSSIIRKRHTPEQIIRKLRTAEQLLTPDRV